MSSKNVNKGGRSQVAFMRLLENNSRLADSASTSIDISDVAAHNKEWDCWIILDQVVYDVTLYLEYHPGGKNNIMRFAGQDATEAFNESHPWVNSDAIIGKLRVGVLRRPASVSVGGLVDVDRKSTNTILSRDAPTPAESLISRSFGWLRGIWNNRF